MDQNGANIKKERHEFVNMEPMSSMESSQMNAIRCESSNNIDMSACEQNVLGSNEPHVSEIDATAISDGVETSSSRRISTARQDAVGAWRLRNDATLKKEPEMSQTKVHGAEPMKETRAMAEPEPYDISSDSSEVEEEDDDETKDGTYEERSEKLAKKMKMKRNRQPPAKNAREFFARLQEKQKASRQEQAKKNSKTQNASGKAKGHKKSTLQDTSGLGMVAQLKQDIRNGEIIREPVVTTMPGMSTCTHAEQLAVISSSIPAGSDIRRSKTQKKDLKQAVKSFGYKALKALDGNWLHKDMKTSLYSYQVTATSWMMQRELAKAGPAGGIIADEMGMGKTLMSLACIVGNPPDEADRKKFVRSTLIIVPNLSVAQQWREEAMKHLSRAFADYVAIYSAKGGMSSDIIGQHHIIITTMHEVRQQFNSGRDKNSIQSEPSIEDMAGIRRKNRQLFELKWYRVILDEAHVIKNKHSKSKEACCFLNAKHRWALSGTPLSNQTAEFMPYLKFIGCDIKENLAAFRREYMVENRANEKLEALISMVMYRRTKKDTFLGHRILDIPNCHTHDIHFTISQEEKVIYDFTKSLFCKLVEELEKEKLVKMEEADYEPCAKLEAQFQQRLDRIHVEQYMHLRMVLSHSYNVENLLRTLPSADQIQKLRQALSGIQGKRTVIDQLLGDARLAAELQPYSSGVEFVQKLAYGAVGGHIDFDVCLNLIQIEREAKVSKCASCGKTPELAVKATKCGHFYCHNCYMTMMENPYMTQSGLLSVGSCNYNGCHKPVLVTRHSQSMERVVWQASQDSWFHEMGVDTNKVSLPRPNGRNGCFLLGQYREDSSSIPSSRLTVAMCVLSSWFIDYPQDQIMVFTQFICTAKVLGLMLQEAGIHFLYYFGCMSSAKKTQALQIFQNEMIGGPRVMLISLQAGGQSLNLACANRIIILDPWWNVTAEQQAIGRAHRIGQKKECHVVRVLTDSDMDNKMLKLQRYKSEEVDYALQDDGHMPTLLDDEQREELCHFTTGEKGKEKQTAP